MEGESKKGYMTLVEKFKIMEDSLIPFEDKHPFSRCLMVKHDFNIENVFSCILKTQLSKLNL